MRKLLPLLLLIGSYSIMAQDTIYIALVNDRVPDSQLEDQFTQSIKNEILQLLQYRYAVGFNEYIGPDNPNSFQEAFANNDLVIGVGTKSSIYAIGLKEYPKPTIASVVMDGQLQGLDKTAEGTSGIQNFTYLESPFNIKRDINLLYEIYPYEHLVLIAEKEAIGGPVFLQQLFRNYLTGKNVSISSTFYGENIEAHISGLAGKKIAAYAFPYFGSAPAVIDSLFQTLNKNKIPSAALFGDQYVNAGALAAYETSNNLQKIPRRIAIDVMKIIEGQNPSDISVEMQTFVENLVLNMETARQIEIYPNFDIMAQATLINLEVKTDNKLTLHEAIAHALKNNLDIHIEQADVSVSETEIAIAQADLLPQVEVSTNLIVYDELTTLSYQGGQGRANWLLSGEVTQTIFAEPVLANVAIQKMLKESEEQELLQTQLDVIIDVTNAYMNILFAKSNLNIQQENVARNKENFAIAKTKEAIGYTGAADINRWEAELANANIELNKSLAGLRQAKFQLNQLLNRPISEAVEVENLSLEASMLLITDHRAGLLEDYGEVRQFADFLVQFAMDRLPELAQIDLGMDVQKRLQLSRQRALYLPTVGISASANRILGKFDIPEGFPSKDNETTWNVGLGISYPIFQGNNRKMLIEQSRYNILQLRDTRKNVENQLELRIRANMETVASSYSAMELSQKAADASQKNYNIVKDAYSAGQSNITTLIDAQNNALATELSAANAVYTFILDFLFLERSIGFYNFLATPAEKDDFFNQASQHLSQK